MNLIAISSPDRIENEAWYINQLFDVGLQVFHLRKADLNKEEYAGIIADILPDFHPRIALHQFHELREDFEIRRLHYPEKLRLTQDTFPDDVIKSTSIHGLQEADQLQDFDYTFLGPVFDSISKPDYLGISTITQDFKKRDHIKIYAVGGISASNIGKIKSLGFDGAALLGTLWKNPHQAVNTFKVIQSIC